MAYMKEELVEPVLLKMAGYLRDAAEHPLVNFEIQRRMENVPASLLELFFRDPDEISIKRWHLMGPYERFSWVGTLLRLRVYGTAIHVESPREIAITRTHYPTNEVTRITVELKLPTRFKNAGNFWKGMDDYCLLVGVCFYMAVMDISGGDPEAVWETI